MSDPAFAELVAWAESRLSRLIDEVFAAVCERIDLYGDEKIVPRADLHRSIAVNLRFMVGALGDSARSIEEAAPGETGRRRARQGAPLPEVLQVYRIGCAMLWDLLVEHVRDMTRPDAADGLVDVASLLWRVADEHAVRLTEAYRAASAELLIAQHRRRSALAAALFTGQRVFDAGAWEAGRLLGLAVDGQLAVVAAETRGLAEESLLGVEQRLAEAGMVSAWQLTPTMQAGVISLRDEQRDTMMSIVKDVAVARTGVSPLYRSLTETPRALHLARTALAGLPPGQPAVRAFGSSPLAAFVAYDPDEGRRLAAEVFGVVLDLPSEERDVLLETLRAYFDQGGSTDGAGGVLHCHANTVRYRLRRIRELTGKSLTDPRDVAELVTAVQALSLDPARGGSADGASAETGEP
ncbi:helix-turn-helix domain-containing protein [Amycolatopsis roodepoortensis]|uniref:PucR family transcriptional regulator n=1 Tax=Amycolatopsis roodepoortensis TaxID=700274 RepID=UPI00214C29A9|nr:PucR family transcriptional regulator [Amycolatopsis roodepoortensis]UUV30033.1 helix-turn-helix domain-containing protein [Amycolatopsis roodepoortensis]